MRRSREPYEIACAILSNRTLTKTANALGCSRSTLYRWIEHPSVRLAVAELLEQSRSRYEDALIELGLFSIDAIKQLMKGDNLNATAKAKLANSVLDRLVRAPGEDIRFE